MLFLAICISLWDPLTIILLSHPLFRVANWPEWAACPCVCSCEILSPGHAFRTPKSLCSSWKFGLMFDSVFPHANCNLLLLFFNSFEILFGQWFSVSPPPDHPLFLKKCLLWVYFRLRNLYGVWQSHQGNSVKSLSCHWTGRELLISGWGREAVVMKKVILF